VAGKRKGGHEQKDGKEGPRATPQGRGEKKANSRGKGGLSLQVTDTNKRKGTSWDAFEQTEYIE